jgi:hypothetical protein
LLSQLHKGLVYSDAKQPGRELGILSELRQVLEGLKKGLLDHILGILCVMRYALSDSEELAIISLYELLESRHVAILGGMDKF